MLAIDEELYKWIYDGIATCFWHDHDASKYLQFIMSIIMKQLKNDPVGKIRHLTNEKLQEYQELINDRHPSLQDGCDTID